MNMSRSNGIFEYYDLRVIVCNYDIHISMKASNVSIKVSDHELVILNNNESLYLSPNDIKQVTYVSIPGINVSIDCSERETIYNFEMDTRTINVTVYNDKYWFDVRDKD